MFERSKVGEEIFADMEKNLRTNAFEDDTYKDKKCLQGVLLLHKAAEYFEKSGMVNEAEAITRITQFVVRPEKVTVNFIPERKVEKLPLKIALKDKKKSDYNDVAAIDTDTDTDNDIEEIAQLWDCH